VNFRKIQINALVLDSILSFKKKKKKKSYLYPGDNSDIQQIIPTKKFVHAGETSIFARGH
jgi:hypothetical protein